MPAPRQADWYDTPRWYDMVFDQGTQQEADFLQAMLARHGPRRGRHVYEPACGSGRLVLALARAGFAVTGSDLNEHMLARARERVRRAGLRARLLRADLAAVPSMRPVHLAHCLVSTFKYLQTERDARAHLRGMADVLAPGGLYVLGLHLSEYGATSCSHERWVAERGGTRVVANIRTWPADRATRREPVRSRLAVTREGHTERTETRWTFRTYDAVQLRRLLRAEPRLELVAVHDFHHDPEVEIPLDGMQLDVVLVLRRRPWSRATPA